MISVSVGRSTVALDIAIEAKLDRHSEAEVIGNSVKSDSCISDKSRSPLLSTRVSDNRQFFFRQSGQVAPTRTKLEDQTGVIIHLLYVQHRY